MRRQREQPSDFDWSGPTCLILWLVVPPVLLYAYSCCGVPVFGPSRYTLFVAPAYLILVAQGLAKLPIFTRSAAVIALAMLIGLEFRNTVLIPRPRANWKGFSSSLPARMAVSHGEQFQVLVASLDSNVNLEIIVARYYLQFLPHPCTIERLTSELSGREAPRGVDLYVAVTSRGRLTVTRRPGPSARWSLTTY